MKNIYVGNLSFNIREENLREEFAKYGEVISIKIIHDAVTHQSRGFGFVDMADDKAAADAIAGLNGASLDGRTLTVNEARPRSEHRDTGGQRPRRRFGS
jgi:RNA recognition motif-containing protein